MAPRLLATAALLAAAGASPKVPPRVAKGAKDWGGGDPSTPGHLRPMQEQGTWSPLKELDEAPSWEVFYRDYVRKNTPVVFRGHAKATKAYKLWTDDYLVKKWGSMSVPVEFNKTEERGGKSFDMPLKKFIKEIYKKERDGQLYALINFDEENKAKMDIDALEPFRCQEVAPQSLTLWMSTGGTKSVLHYDDAENFLMMLAGRKSIMLVHQDEAPKLYAKIADIGGTSPVHQDAVDLEAFPRFANVSWIKGELGPGDTLYIPHSYWHQVVSYERNLAVNMWWGHRDVEASWWEPFNEKVYDPSNFGSEGFTKFDELKGQSAETTSCKPLKGDDLSKMKFVEETRWKKYVAKKSKERIEGKRPAPKKEL